MSVSTFNNVAKQDLRCPRDAGPPVPFVACVLPHDVVVGAEYRLEDLSREQRRHRTFPCARAIRVDEGVARVRLVVAHARRGHTVCDQLLGVRVAGVAVVVIAAIGLLQDRPRHSVAVHERRAFAVYRVRR